MLAQPGPQSHRVTAAGEPEQVVQNPNRALVTFEASTRHGVHAIDRPVVDINASKTEVPDCGGTIAGSIATEDGGNK